MLRVGMMIAKLGLLAGSTLACLWYYGTDIHGQPVSVSALSPKIFVKRLTDFTEHARRKGMLPVDPGPGADFKARSDYAATLVYQGKAKEAVAIFEEIEKTKPGEYVVAANLGTAYELAGDLDKARHWISEAIRRNPDSHYGTEWLHVLILDARQALAKDPAWLDTHSVLGLDFGRDKVPQAPSTLPTGKDLKAVRSALEYQLHERMGFVAAPDPIVGDLLADFGNVLALTMTVEHALPIYDLALTYNAPRAELNALRRAQFQQAIADRERRNTLKWAGGVGLALAVIVLVAAWSVRRQASSTIR